MAGSLVCGEGRSGPRSRSGCWTCRTKKVKCDEQRPHCRRCTRLKLLCDYAPRTGGTGNLRLRLAKSRAWVVMGPSRPSAPGSPTTWAQQAASTRALVLPVQLPELPTSASSLELSSADHEAIRYYRTTFARIHHTKNPDYSLFSIIFNIAEREPIVMRVLLALGGRETEFRRKSSPAAEASPARWTPLQHYSAALRLMADAIGSGDNGGPLDTDVICAALYLMVLYEEKYGDAKCSGLSNHLAGAAMILKHRLQDLPRLIPPASAGRKTKMVALARKCPSGTGGGGRMLSLVTARLLVWIAQKDSAASTFGVGGQLNAAFHHLMAGMSPMEALESVHRFSNPLYRTMWADAYPQSELVDDVENRTVFEMLGECCQLRFMNAQLGSLNLDEARQRAPAVEAALRQVGQRYFDLLEVATELSTDTDNSHRLVANIRAIVPHYHAAVVEYLSMGLGGTNANVGEKEKEMDMEMDMEIGDLTRSTPHIRAIINLAFQAFKHQGDEAMVRIAWPLLIVGLETDDMLHRDWIVARFRGMCHLGQNLARAHTFLVETLQMQAQLGHRVSVRERFQSGEVELFVI